MVLFAKCVRAMANGLGRNGRWNWRCRTVRFCAYGVILPTIRYGVAFPRVLQVTVLVQSRTKSSRPFLCDFPYRFVGVVGFCFWFSPCRMIITLCDSLCPLFSSPELINVIGPLAYWGRSRRRRGWSSSSSPEATTKTETEEDDAAAPFAYVPAPLQPQRGEVVGALGCGDWRLYQIAAGNKLTVDDFVCAWVAAEEVRKRGYGGKTPLLPRGGGGSTGTDDEANPETADPTWMFGENAVGEETATVGGNGSTGSSTGGDPLFHHADLGTGCGSVLLMLAWAFRKDIASVGIEAQSVSFQCARRGLEWNVRSTCRTILHV